MQKCTVAQLRKQARVQGLNVSRLTEKWEIIHVLVEQSKHGSANPHIENTTDTKRRTFFDLPGEIRNKIYSYLLDKNNLVVVHHHSSAPAGEKIMVYPMTLHHLLPKARPLPPPNQKPNPKPDSQVTQLLNMSWANRELHREYRSYFFAHHVFHVVGPNRSSYSHFLDQIGPVARASLADMVLDDSNFWLYSSLECLLVPQLVGLRTLSIFMHLGHLVAFKAYARMRAYVLGDDVPLAEIEVPLSVYNPGFHRLPALRTLEIKCAVPDWKKHVKACRLRREKVDRHMGRVVMEAAENALEGRGVEVTVRLVNGGAVRLKDIDTGSYY